MAKAKNSLFVVRSQAKTASQKLACEDLSAALVAEDDVEADFFLRGLREVARKEEAREEILTFRSLLGR